MRLTLFSLLLSLSVLQSCAQSAALKTGDILFLSSEAGQGKAIQLATHSRYTHVGVVFIENGETYVYHAVEPVMKSTLSEFLQFSADGKFVARRLKNQGLLNKEGNQKMLSLAKALLGKHYDIYFSWNDDEWYCSEFVWKLYQRAYNLEVGKLNPLKSYDLSSPVVQYIMHKRYGDKIPLEEQMVSPQDIFESPLLEEVKAN